MVAEAGLRPTGLQPCGAFLQEAHTGKQHGTPAFRLFVAADGAVAHPRGRRRSSVCAAGGLDMCMAGHCIGPGKVCLIIKVKKVPVKQLPQPGLVELSIQY